MKEARVVTCFLLRRTPGGDEILLLRRSQEVGTYRGRWAGISGYLEKEPLAQAYAEIQEEAGLGKKDVRLLRAGEPLVVVDAAGDRRWIVHPFLFEVSRPEKVQLDWEHVESRWIRPQEIRQYETVPQLAETLGRVYPSPSSGQAPSPGSGQAPPPQP